MCAPQKAPQGHVAYGYLGASSRTAAKEVPTSASNAPQAPTLATTALRRRLPRELTALVLSFLAGSRGWHMDDACEHGAVNLALSIHSAQAFTSVSVCTSLAMDRAASIGDLGLVRWLHENRTEGCSQTAFYDAARNNHVRVLQWLFGNKLDGVQVAGTENGVLYHAVQAGHVAVIEWLCTASPTIVPLYNVFDHACRCGHLPVVRLLHRLGRQNPVLAKCSKNAMDAAADRGYLDVVQWLHQHRSEGCTTNAMDYAASRGHLHVLRWLHRHRTEGCTRKALLNAVSGGHVDIVQWLLDDHVIPVDATLLHEAMEFAAYRDHKALWSLLSRTERSTSSESPLGDLFVMTQMRMTT